MGNRLFISAVLLLWFSSMTWLVVDKILPSFFGGKPPATSGLETGKTVAWRVKWAGRPVGWAASLRMQGTSNTTELRNRVLLKDVPLLDLAPTWMRTIVGSFGNMKFDTQTLIELDALGNFASFRSRVAVNDIPSVFRISGRMLDSQLEFKVRSGSLTYTTQAYIPNQAALSEALFPDARLPYMYVGRHWQKEVFSPFKSPGTPVELVEAEVVAIESLQYGDETVRVMRIDYRSLPGPGIPEANRLQAVTWVEPKSGMVLRQDVYIANSKLRFERLADEIAGQIGLEFFPNELDTEWSSQADKKFPQRAGFSVKRSETGAVPADDSAATYQEVTTSLQDFLGKFPAFTREKIPFTAPRDTPSPNPPSAAKRMNTR
jgi:hypothetical protein